MLPKITRSLVLAALLIALWGAGILESAHDLLHGASMSVIQSVYGALLDLLSYIGLLSQVS